MVLCWGQPWFDSPKKRFLKLTDIFDHRSQGILEIRATFRLHGKTRNAGNMYVINDVARAGVISSLFLLPRLSSELVFFVSFYEDNALLFLTIF
jgi:hypothetical protein